MTECIRRVARSVRELLKQEQVRRDARSCDPDFLALCERGAARLTLFGAPKDATLMIDATYLIDAHTAACLLAKRRRFTQTDREDLLQVLGFIASILPVWVVAENLPPWEKIPKAGPHLKRVPNIYEKLRTQRVSDIGFHPIRMGDALILREGLKLKAHGSLQVLRGDLDHVTLTHRNALADLMRSTE